MMKFWFFQALVWSTWKGETFFRAFRVWAMENLSYHNRVHRWGVKRTAQKPITLADAWAQREEL